MSHPQTRRWSDDRRHVDPTPRGVRAASWVVVALAVVLLALIVQEAITSGVLDVAAFGGWR